jgi:hypothetical protein
MLAGKTNQEVIAETEALIEALSKSYYKDGIEKMYDRYNRCIGLEARSRVKTITSKRIRIIRIQENIRISIRIFSTCNRLFEYIRMFQKRYSIIFEYFKILSKKSRKKYIFAREPKRFQSFTTNFFFSKELIGVNIILKPNP